MLYRFEQLGNRRVRVGVGRFLLCYLIAVRNQQAATVKKPAGLPGALRTYALRYKGGCDSSCDTDSGLPGAKKQDSLGAQFTLGQVHRRQQATGEAEAAHVEHGHADLEEAALDELGIRYPDGNDVVKPLVEGRSECDPVALTCPTTGYISDTSIDPDRENP